MNARLRGIRIRPPRNTLLPRSQRTRSRSRCLLRTYACRNMLSATHVEGCVDVSNKLSLWVGTSMAAMAERNPDAMFVKRASRSSTCWGQQNSTCSSDSSQVCPPASGCAQNMQFRPSLSGCSWGRGRRHNAVTQRRSEPQPRGPQVPRPPLAQGGALPVTILLPAPGPC